MTHSYFETERDGPGDEHAAADLAEAAFSATGSASSPWRISADRASASVGLVLDLSRPRVQVPV